MNMLESFLSNVESIDELCDSFDRLNEASARNTLKTAS
jgi:hypothetical protein